MKGNVLIFPRTMGLGGTENVVLQLCETLKDEKYKIVVCSCGGVNVKELEKMGIKHYLIPDIEHKNPKVIFEVLKTLIKIIKTENITIVHTQHRMAAFYAHLLLRKYKFTFINTAHNTFHDKKILTRFAYKNAHIIAVGEMVKKNLCEYYKLPEKQNVLRQCPKIKFFIIGDDEDKDKISKMIIDMNLTKDVIMLGYRSDIQNIMSQLDLIELSSLLGDFPLTPIEAFLVGKTIVAAAVDGTIEIVKDRKNGLLVESKNSNEITNAILRVANNLTLRKIKYPSVQVQQLIFLQEL